MIYVIYVRFCAIIGIVIGITKQIVTDVIGEYLKLSPQLAMFPSAFSLGEYSQLRGNNFKYSPHRQQLFVYCIMLYFKLLNAEQEN